MVRDIDKAVVVERVEPLTTLVATSFDQPRFATTVLVTIATLALTLASLGLYGVLSYSVSQRRRELGVRAALGAGRGDLIALVMREGLSLTIVGIIVGLLTASTVTPFLRNILFGLTPLDPVAFMVAPAMLVLVAIAACLVPALRAASVDPATTLRGD